MSYESKAKDANSRRKCERAHARRFDPATRALVLAEDAAKRERRGREVQRLANKRSEIKHPETKKKYCARPDVKLKVAEAGRRWRRTTKGKLTLRAEWTMRRNAPGSHTAGDIAACLVTQGHRCFYCLASLLDGFEADHMTPVVRGGTHNPDNMVCACIPCNRRKHTKNAAEFILGKPAGSLPCPKAA